MPKFFSSIVFVFILVCQITIFSSCKKDDAGTPSNPALVNSVFNPNLTYGTMSDNDGNTYKTIIIGTQTWMAENLKTSKYRNGNAIPTDLTNPAWSAATTGAYSIYNNDASNNTTYGKLYNWYAVADSRNLCPVGWHVPSDAEWTTLENFLGGSSLAGSKLKSTSTLWNPNMTSTNESGFSGLPGGGRYYDLDYIGISLIGSWWSSTEYSSDYALARDLYYDYRNTDRLKEIKMQGCSVRCLKGDEAINLATLSTTTISSVTSTTASSGGNISNEGGGAITARGVCWSTTQNPTLALTTTRTINGTGIGSFTSNLTGLSPNTMYYVRAYATNSAGTAYGNQQTLTTTAVSGVFNPNLTYGMVSDNDGNTYKTIVIGMQTWMAENLKVSKYRNGDSIPTDLSNTAWQNATTGANAIYKEDASNITIYGKLYNWYAVADSRNLCPIGWHVPTDADWTTLENYLGGTSVAGGKLKSTSSVWETPNTGATNESGFSGLPGGERYPNGTYDAISGRYGNWWSSTEISATNAWSHNLFNNSGYSGRNYFNKQIGFSVRCLMD